MADNDTYDEADEIDENQIIFQQGDGVIEAVRNGEVIGWVMASDGPGSEPSKPDTSPMPSKDSYAIDSVDRAALKLMGRCMGDTDTMQRQLSHAYHHGTRDERKAALMLTVIAGHAALDGGPGSGNFNHLGNPPNVGGAGKGRKMPTSLGGTKKETERNLKTLKSKSKLTLITSKGKIAVWTKQDDGTFSHGGITAPADKMADMFDKFKNSYTVIATSPDKKKSLTWNMASKTSIQLIDFHGMNYDDIDDVLVSMPIGTELVVNTPQGSQTYYKKDKDSFDYRKSHSTYNCGTYSVGYDNNLSDPSVKCYITNLSVAPGSSGSGTTTSAPAPAAAAPSIPPSMQLDPAQFTYKGHNNMGTGNMYQFTENATGDEYIFKPAVPKNSKKSEPFRAYVQEAGYKVQSIINPDTALPIGVVKMDTPDGKFLGSMQKRVTDLDPSFDIESWQKGYGSAPSADVLSQLQRENVTDWLMCNYDSHGRNFLLTKDGKLIGVDKEQGFRYLSEPGAQKMSYNYHPNSIYNETEPIYNTMYRKYAKGEIDLNLNDTLASIKRIEAIPDSDYREMFRDYAEALHGKGAKAEQLLDQIVDRKKNLRKTFEDFYSQLETERNGGTPTTFKFVDNTTTSASTASAQPAPASTVTSTSTTSSTSATQTFKLTDVRSEKVQALTNIPVGAIITLSSSYGDVQLQKVSSDTFEEPGSSAPWNVSDLADSLDSTWTCTYTPPAPTASVAAPQITPAPATVAAPAPTVTYNKKTANTAIQGVLDGYNNGTYSYDETVDKIKGVLTQFPADSGVFLPGCAPGGQDAAYYRDKNDGSWTLYMQSPKSGKWLAQKSAGNFVSADTYTIATWYANCSQNGTPAAVWNVKKGSKPHPASAQPASQVQSSTSASTATVQTSAQNAIDVTDIYNRMSSKSLSTNRMEVDQKLRSQAGQVWNSCTQSQKQALASYTGTGYTGINDALRGKTLNPPSYIKNKINGIISAIDKSVLQEDMWVRRGIWDSDLASMLGITEHELHALDPASFVGKDASDKAFMSTGCAAGKGFDKSVELKIFCPKGTKGLYCEPFSSSGNGDGINWDGKSKQYSLSGEQEVLLQRGTHLTITKAERKNGKYYVTAYVTSQDTSTPW